MPTDTLPVEAVVFDIGGVLVDGDYRHLYRKLIADENEMERFLATICTQDWHRRHDAGYPMRDGVAGLVAQHPDHAELIKAWDVRFPEVWAGPIHDTVALAAELKKAGLPLYLLSNWPAEKYPIAKERFPFLVELFDGEVISGYEGVLKPDPQIFDLLSDRFTLTPARTLFIDDNDDNVRAASILGYQAIRFTGSAELRAAIRSLGVL